MPRLNEETIPSLLVKNIPRELVMGLEEAVIVGSQRAYAAARGMNDGHLPSVVGYLRHFHINETFHRALAIADASPSPLCGNRIITGRSGIVTLARFNVKSEDWSRGRRSKTRKQLSRVNSAIEPLVQSDLFSGYVKPPQVVVFIVACFAESLHGQPETPLVTEIAVPDRYMQGWLFRESIHSFIRRYEPQLIAGQDDLAVPKLKKNICRQQDKTGTET